MILLLFISFRKVSNCAVNTHYFLHCPSIFQDCFRRANNKFLGMGAV